MSYPNPYGGGYPSQPQGGYPPAGGTPGYPPGGQQPGYPPQGGAPGYPGYPGQSQGGPGYPGSGGSYPGHPQSGQGSYPMPQPGGAPSYPGGGSGYPGQPAAGYPSAGYGGGAPSYPAQPGAPSYPAQPGAPSYPAQPGAPSYPAQPAAPSYPGQPGAPSYPGQPAQGGWSGGGAPGYPQQPAGHPGYGGQQPQYAPAHGGGAPTGYPQQHPPSNYSPAAPHGQGGTPAAGSGVAGLAPAMAQMSIGRFEKYRGTVIPDPKFDAERDAEILRKAMKGLGTDEKAIIEVITNRGNAQRQEIKRKFKTMYGKDLIKDLKSELGGKLEEVVLGLFETPTYYDAWTLREAMSGPGTKESVLIEILCSRTNREVHDIVKCYKEFFKRDLEKDVIKETSGHFRRLLVSMCQGNRDEPTPEQLQRAEREGLKVLVDYEKAAKEARQLYEAGEKKLGTDESTFNRIICVRHYYQLQATFNEYAKIAGKDITKSIKSEFSGDIEDAMLALVEISRDRPAYFASRLRSSMKGAGTNDHKLIRVIITRSEIDLENTRQVYQKKYGKSLSDHIKGDTSGDYRKILLALVKEDFQVAAQALKDCLK